MERQHTVLTIDDDRDVLSVTRMTLEAEGYRVLTAVDGPSGLEAARRARPDLILLDILMPGMSGFQVLEELRKDEVTRRIPIVMLTVLSERERTLSVLERGVKYYMVKPFEYDELISQVRTALAEAEEDISQSAPPPDGKASGERRPGHPGTGL